MTALFERHRILTQVAGTGMDVLKLIPALSITNAEVREVTLAFADVMADHHVFRGYAVPLAWQAAGGRRGKG